MDKSTKKKIEKITNEFIEKTSFDISFEVKGGEDGIIVIDLKTEEPQTLIGEGGQTLAEMQMIISRIVKRQLGPEIAVHLDINHYRQGRLRWLKEIAIEAANRVALTKREESLPAMPAYERKFVHTELALRNDVKTESVGEGPDRQVIVKPI